jgi:hypothetical protein
MASLDPSLLILYDSSTFRPPAQRSGSMANITILRGSPSCGEASWVRGPTASPSTPRRAARACLLALVAALLPTGAWAGGGKAAPLEAVADTRDLAPGFTRFLADTYNANLWLYGMYVVLIMAGLGLILGLAVDKLMGLTGINLGKIEHRE